MPASGWGSLWESSSFVPCFVPNAFRDVSGAVSEWPWTSGFMRKSSRRDKAPNMRLCVLLNSCDNFFVTLPSISSETWVMSSGDLGLFEFCANLLLGCSSQFSLLNAASFLLFIRVASFYGKSDCRKFKMHGLSWRQLKWLFYSFLIMEVIILVNIVSTTEW